MHSSSNPILSKDNSDSDDDALIVNPTENEVSALRKEMKELKKQFEEKEQELKEALDEKSKLQKEVKAVQEATQAVTERNQELQEFKYAVFPDRVKKLLKETVGVAERLDENIQKQEALSKAQSARLIIQYRLRNQFLRIADKMPALKAKLADAKKRYTQTQSAQYKERASLAWHTRVNEAVAVREFREAAIEHLQLKIQIENRRYQCELKPLHQELTELLDSSRPILLRSAKVLKEMDSTQKTLAALVDQRVEDEKKLKLKSVKQCDLLQLFGGRRKPKTYADKLKEKAVIQANFFAEFQEELPDYAKLDWYIKSGADINAKIPGKDYGVIFDVLISRRYVAIGTAELPLKIDWLLKNKADFNVQLEKEYVFKRGSFGFGVYDSLPPGTTPLMVYVRRFDLGGGSLDFMDSLIFRLGVNINAQDDQGNTVLHLLAHQACKNENDNHRLDDFRTLLKFNPNIEIYNNNGETPWDILGLDCLKPQPRSTCRM